MKRTILILLMCVLVGVPAFQVGGSSLAGGTGQAAGDAGAAPPDGLTRIEISFLPDPSIARGMYTGNRWVSPPTFTGVRQKGQDLEVPARAMGYDEKGSPVNIHPVWQSGDTAVIQVAPTEGPEVKLTVLKEGRTSLAVKAGGITRRLTVKAVAAGNALRVDISRDEADSTERE